MLGNENVRFFNVLRCIYALYQHTAVGNNSVGVLFGNEISNLNVCDRHYEAKYVAHAGNCNIIAILVCYKYAETFHTCVRGAGEVDLNLFTIGDILAIKVLKLGLNVPFTKILGEGYVLKKVLCPKSISLGSQVDKVTLIKLSDRKSVV